MPPKEQKIRLDELLLSRNLAEKLQEAQGLIMSGQVVVNHHKVDKPGALVKLSDSVRLKAKEHNFVSRGGLKLEHALLKWPVATKDFVAMDVGASHGGFTEVLLKHGAKQVIAVDVAYGILADSLRNDDRVINLERTHILKLDESYKADIITVDVSFISLRKILPKIVSHLKSKGQIYALIKPQFELLKSEVGIGGIVRDVKVQEQAVALVTAFAADLGLKRLDCLKSPILGAKGNQEYVAIFQAH